MRGRDGARGREEAEQELAPESVRLPGKAAICQPPTLLHEDEDEDEDEDDDDDDDDHDNDDDDDDVNDDEDNH